MNDRFLLPFFAETFRHLLRTLIEVPPLFSFTSGAGGNGITIIYAVGEGVSFLHEKNAVTTNKFNAKTIFFIIFLIY